ncbi:MAG: ISNCY family transposase, partial [Planctomycetia bacterium]
ARLVASLGTRAGAGSAAELGEADRERWRALRESLERRRRRRVERRQFRRDPESYLKALENKLNQ